MKILENISLKKYSTMRLGGIAAFLTEIQNKQELIEALAWAEEKRQPVIMIGGGSNIYWSDDGFDGLVIVNKILGYDEKKEKDKLTLTIGAGEVWDSVVDRAVKSGATGIESLSLIPGSTGATMVQNVGAYGQEISQTLVELEAYDTQEKKFISITNKECGFGYRNSRFKTTDKGRFLIVRIKLILNIGNPSPPYYSAVQDYLKENKIETVTPSIIRNAVIEIRKSKLPDPEIIANNGSFFANPVIDDQHFKQLKKDYPEIVNWPIGKEDYKISAAWLIEEAGFKGVHDDETGMATWEKQPLVLVNEHAEKTSDLLEFKQKIVDKIKTDFDIELVQEPEMLP